MLHLTIIARNVPEVRIAIRRFLIVCGSNEEGYNPSGEKTQCEIVKEELKKILLAEEEIEINEATGSRKNQSTDTTGFSKIYKIII